MSAKPLGLFEGVRCHEGTAVLLDGENLDPRYDLWNHSPTGFEWGYEGSGPAQLALAMIAAVADDRAVTLSCYQDFKSGIVANFRANSWAMPVADVARWIRDWCKRTRYQPGLFVER